MGLFLFLRRLNESEFEMDLTEFGSTGLKVTPVGLGLAALGRPGYINLGHAQDLQSNYDVAAMESRAHEVLDAAWAAGIRYFDVARSYGKAEQFLSSWLHKRNLEPNKVTVGSKWGYSYTAEWQVEADKHEIKNHSLPVLEKQINESHSLLTDRLNLYQIHSATLDSGVLDNLEVLGKLARMRRGGLRIGLSLSGSEQAATLWRAMEIHMDGERIFDAVQATWNLLEMSVGPALREASESGMGVIIKEALANGRLTSRNQDPAFHSQRTLLETAAIEMEVTIDSVALAAVLAQPWTDVVLSGATTKDQLRSNVRALDIEWTDELAEHLTALKESPAKYWSTRSRLPWN